MFYPSLKSIETELKLKLTDKQLLALDELLQVAPHNSTISPHFISRESAIDIGSVKKILTRLVTRGILEVNFIINCSNDFNTKVFNNEYELYEYLQKNNDTVCEDCSIPINNKKVKVFFKVPSKKFRSNKE